MDLTTLYKVSYGLYVVSAAADDRLNGHIANTVFQISNEPPTIAVSTNKQNFTHDLIVSSGKFAVSILAESTPMELIQKFGFKTGRDIDKLASTSYRIGATGAPIVLDHTIGFLEAEVVDSLDAGTHTVFLGRIVASENLTNEPPMTYAYYHQVKKGRAPKTAPTYQAAPAPKASEFPQYQCAICGYIYDPAQGDPANNIAPGTLFADLPDSWCCPLCGAPKDAFQAL
mgnify:CR=1 FL=1|jgi:flavin reductase (DIM6/NTAB) family NADH-FMN oxidoreductase RutF/rubredoxin